MTNNTAEIKPGAILVSAWLQKTTADDHEASFKELERLVETLGNEVVATVTQKLPSYNSATLIGPGKLEEVALLLKGPKPAKFLVFDHELSPRQIRNIKEATGAEVLDRPAVILEIFNRHARTKEARLQVEIARIKYLAPREREEGNHDRKGSGPGEKGLGESPQELERRRTRDRIVELQRELEHIHNEQVNRRKNREGQPKVAIVGYTNAGKSSVMRALTSSDVLVADQLFATLDTTIRALSPETHPRILVSDTVGFIRNLPLDLVASFRSTLDEALDASLLLFVVDASDPAFRSQLEVTREVLASIGAGQLPSVLALNKIDVVDILNRAVLKKEFPEALLMSALVPADIEALRLELVDYFVNSMSEEEFLIPFSKEGSISDIRRNVIVVKEDYEQGGLRITIKADKKTLSSLKKKIGS